MIDNNALLIIDAQDRIINPIKEKELILNNIKKVIRAYEILGKNIFFSEQNPIKLGSTINDLIPKKNFKVFEKMDFSLGCNHEFNKELSSRKIKNLIICGFETHICIQQSVLDLIEKNYNTYIVVDTMGSRNFIDHNIALKRMHSRGAILATTESIIFELCNTSARKEFKSISNIIKNK